MATNSYPPVHIPVTKFGTWTRVLDILPGRFGTDVALELRHHNISDQSRQYEALSYTWGPTTEDRSVTVNKHYRLPVTDNLYLALQRLRLRDHHRTIWIDAICINQQDAEERGSQVAIMGEIYRKASIVDVWLGESGPADTATQDSAALADALYYHSHSFRSKESRQLKSKIARGELTHLESAMRKFHSPWYERVWVIQEFRLASQALLLFGDFSWTYSELDRVAQGLQESSIRRSFPGRFHDRGIEKLYDRIRPVNSTSAGLSQSQGVGLHQRMRLIQNTAATDPRDFVYSILSLIDAREASWIDVNYDLPVQKVFVQATYASLKAREAHTILADLYHDQPTDRMAGLPSWAVDFSPAPPGARGARPAPREMSLGLFRPANKAQVTSISLDGAYERLTLSGLRCGVVVAIRNLITPQKLRDIYCWIDEIIRPSTIHERQNSLFLRRALHRLPVPQRRQEEGEWYASASTAIIQYRRNVPFSLEYPFIFWDDIARASSQYSRDGPAAVAAVKYEYEREHSRSPVDGSEWYLELRGASLFALDNGLIGLSRCVIEVDDEIVAIPCADECTSPFIILRPYVDGTYTFRGLAYVHGCMTPAFWEDWPCPSEGDIELEKLVIV